MAGFVEDASYDAAYLVVAVERTLPLATLGTALAAAARREPTPVL